MRVDRAEQYLSAEQIEEQWAALEQETVWLITDVAVEGAEVFIDNTSGNRRYVQVQDNLAVLRNLLLALELRAGELDGEENEVAAQAHLQACQKSYSRLRTSLRRAKIQSQENGERLLRKQKQLLLSSTHGTSTRRRQLQTQADLTGAAESVTDNLRRTRQIMAQEVERGTATLQAMEDSRVTLKRAHQEYIGQNSMLAFARRILSVLQRQDFAERLVLALGSLLFVLVCLYIVQKRVPLVRTVASSAWSLTPSLGIWSFSPLSQPTRSLPAHPAEDTQLYAEEIPVIVEHAAVSSGHCWSHEGLECGDGSSSGQARLNFASEGGQGENGMEPKHKNIQTAS